MECLEKQTSWNFFKFAQIFDPSFISTICDPSIYKWQEVSKYFPFAPTSSGIEKEFAKYLNWVVFEKPTNVDVWSFWLWKKK